MMNEEGLITLEDCHEMVDELWDDEAKELFGTKENMTMNMILIFMSSLMNVNLTDPTVLETIAEDKNPLELIKLLFNK